MIYLVIIPEEGADFDQLMRLKESELSDGGRGTFRTNNPKRKKYQTWTHSTYPGKVEFASTLSAPVVVEISCDEGVDCSQILGSFVAFLYRHFRQELRTVLLDLDNQQLTEKRQAQRPAKSAKKVDVKPTPKKKANKKPPAIPRGKR